MKISEIVVESNFDSDEPWFNDQRRQLVSAIVNFDEVVKRNGTAGANIYFDKIISNINEVDWVMRPLAMTNPKYTKQYNKMNELKDQLQTKIKNSGGLSY